jgi:predicted DNA-binding transcriptional regulator AlpA
MPETETQPKRARRVIRLHQLPAYLGVQRSQIDAAIKKGLLHPFSPVGGRAMVVFEDEVADLQEAQAAAQARRSDADA